MLFLMNNPPELPMALLANRVFKACEADFFEALGGAGYSDIRMRHTALFEALDEEGTRGSVLAERLGMTQQAMAQLLDDTEAAGYITRIPDTTDRRARVVMLTEQGRAAVELCYTLLSRIEREYAQLLNGGDEYASLKRGLTRLLNTLASRPAMSSAANHVNQTPS